MAPDPMSSLPTPRWGLSAVGGSALYRRARPPHTRSAHAASRHPVDADPRRRRLPGKCGRETNGSPGGSPATPPTTALAQAFASSPELVEEIDMSGANLALFQQRVRQRGLYSGGDKHENHLSPTTRVALAAYLPATPPHSCRPGAPAIQPGWKRPPPAPSASTPNCSADRSRRLPAKRRYRSAGLLADKGYRIEQFHVQ